MPPVRATAISAMTTPAAIRDEFSDVLVEPPAQRQPLHDHGICAGHEGRDGHCGRCPIADCGEQAKSKRPPQQHHEDPLEALFPRAVGCWHRTRGYSCPGELSPVLHRVTAGSLLPVGRLRQEQRRRAPRQGERRRSKQTGSVMRSSNRAGPAHAAVAANAGRLVVVDGVIDRAGWPPLCSPTRSSWRNSKSSPIR